VARLAISKDFLAEYAKLDKHVQRAVDQASLGISVRGRSRRLSLNYRTTQEILAWAVPLLGTEPVTGLDGEVDSLIGYRSPMHGPRPQHKLTVSRAEEFTFLAERIGSWLSDGLEPHAIGVAARSAALVREAREALRTAGIVTVSLNGRGGTKAVRAGTMHAMKGARSRPELVRAAQDAPSVVRSAERLVVASPYRRAAAQIAARRELPAMSISLALVARISARGDEACRSFERAWRSRWTDLAQHASRLTSIDLVLAEALIAATERA